MLPLKPVGEGPSWISLLLTVWVKPDVPQLTDAALSLPPSLWVFVRLSSCGHLLVRTPILLDEGPPYTRVTSSLTSSLLTAAALLPDKLTF